MKASLEREFFLFCVCEEKGILIEQVFLSGSGF